MSIWAIVSFEFEGFHKWDSAPIEVSFLRNLHRHMFKCKVFIEQKHNERDVEYIQVKKALNSFSSSFIEKETDSCETIAYNIKNWLDINFPERRNKVEVTEDGENGAFID